MAMKQYVLEFTFSCGLLYTVSWVIYNACETEVFGIVSLAPCRWFVGICKVTETEVMEVFLR